MEDIENCQCISADLYRDWGIYSEDVPGQRGEHRSASMFVCLGMLAHLKNRSPDFTEFLRVAYGSGCACSVVL